MLAISALQQQLVEPLTELGLRPQEMDLYIQGLIAGPGSVTSFADSLGLSAPNVYKLIHRLEEVGLTAFSQQTGYHRVLRVEPPTKIVELLQLRRREVERLAEGVRVNMPDLLASFYQGDTPPTVKTLQGEVQFQRATKQMFQEEGKEILLIGSIDDFVQTVSPEFFTELTKERLEKNIRLRSLLTSSPLAKELQKRGQQELREVRFLPKDVTVASMQLSERKAIIWQPKAPLAVLIEDVYIVQLLRVMFEQIWEKG